MGEKAVSEHEDLEFSSPVFRKKRAKEVNKSNLDQLRPRKKPYSTVTKNDSYVTELEIQERNQSSSQLNFGDSIGALQDSEFSVSTSFQWDKSAIRLLLSTRLGMEKEFCNPSCKKRKLWDKIAIKLNNIFKKKEKLTADMCDLKYRNMLGTYRVNKNKQNKTGKGAIRWKYFEMIDEVLGHKASSAPHPILLGGAGSSKVEALEEIEVFEEEKSEVAPSSKKVKNKEKEKNELSLEKYLYLKHEREERKWVEMKERDERKWQEKKDLKEKEIDAINNLAAAVLQSRQN